MFHFYLTIQFFLPEMSFAPLSSSSTIFRQQTFLLSDDIRATSSLFCVHWGSDGNQLIKWGQWYASQQTKGGPAANLKLQFMQIREED